MRHHRIAVLPGDGIGRDVIAEGLATLAQVAPGISEALVTTAFGLFAAIPAVIAYNRFADQVARLEIRFDAFTEEFSTILQRHASRGAGTPSVVPAGGHGHAAGHGAGA